MLNEIDRMRDIVMRNRKGRKSTSEEVAIEFAAAAILVAREYRYVMILAVTFSMCIFASYGLYRIYERVLYDQVLQKIEFLEGKCQNAR